MVLALASYAVDGCGFSASTYYRILIYFYDMIPTSSSQLRRLFLVAAIVLGLTLLFYSLAWRQHNQAWQNIHSGATTAYLAGTHILKTALPDNTGNTSTVQSNSTAKLSRTITDTNPGFQIQLPPDWVRRTNRSTDTAAYITYIGQLSTDMTAPYITINIYSNQLVDEGMGEAMCEADMHSAMKTDSLDMQNYREDAIAIQGANKAVLENSTNSQGTLLTLYACTSGRFFDLSAGNLGPSHSLAETTAKEALATFRITHP